MTFLYLGSPYSHLEPSVMQERHDKACKVMVDLTQLGHTVYSPIVHFHYAAVRYTLPTDATFWEKHNFNMLSQAKALLILQIPGWRESKGLEAERTFCRRNHIQVRHIAPGQYFALRNL